MHSRKKALLAATAGTAAGVVGLGLIAMPAGAGSAPRLPDISAEKLTESVLTADTPAMAGTISVDNNLGLPAIPGAAGGGDLLNIDSARVHTDGKDGKRVSIEKGSDEQTVISNARTTWIWDSEKREATKIPAGGRDVHRQAPAHAQRQLDDPTAAARQLVEKMHESSTVRVDGTARVADRPAYELVLTPKPTERTLLREVRVAVDSETRLPLRFTALTNGTSEPALRIEFTEVSVGAQPAELFRFTPPEGAKVNEERAEAPKRPKHAKPADRDLTVVGDGWDSVVVARSGQGIDEIAKAAGAGNGRQGTDPRAMLDRLGKKVSGPFGTGWVVSANVGNVLITEDGRLAAGAVPEQVLTEALGKTK
ncbi:MAG: outer membrane lipoprotein carrier protein LolA [Pseudonocardiaceae bacterium]|nr:outer membrane lipoprotein carrier protein LolA [Pseudonocardiaceae bacterium]